MLGYWNTFLLVASIGLLFLTNGPQPRFHALIMLCTGFLGMRLLNIDIPETWSVGFLVYIVLSFITLALSPLQLVLLWCLSSKPEIEPGIVIHHEGDKDGNIPVDIVAVHGLGSNPAWAWTWEDKQTGRGCMWLKDLLPESIPRARIMAYNHNSAWFRDAPVKSVRVCGEQLLESLNTCRKLPQEVERPIIFIGHSFGGIIIKQALVAAGEKDTDSTHQSIENSMHGAIFLGVPHDGSRLTVWGMLLSYCTYWLGSSTELLEALESGAGLLRQLNRSFITSYRKRDLVDFFELHKTKTLGISLLLGVDVHSSTNAGVKRIPLETDHIGMNKFKSEEQHNYKLVLGQITRMVDRIEGEQSKVLSLEQEECQQSLYLGGSESRWEAIEKPHKSTYQWVDDNDIIRDWMENKSQVAWVSGKPGSGKSTISKHFLERMIEQRKQQSTPNHTTAVIGFFFNDRGSKDLNSERGFLQALLHQFVKQIPSLSCLVPKPEKDHTGKSVLLSLDSLRKTLLSMIGDPKTGSTRLIIDAFDECGEECKMVLLKFVLEDLARHPSLPQILITSRRQPVLEMYLEAYPTIKLEDLNSEDIHTYLRSKLEIFDRDHGPEFVKGLVEKAVARSKGVFLWVKLVVKELQKGKMLVGTSQELGKALDSLPGDLVGFYDHILEGLDTSTGAEGRRMLEWVLFASRPLSVGEFRYAIAIGSEPPPSDLASVGKAMVPTSRMEARIREYSGGFLEVVKRPVSSPRLFKREAAEGLVVVQLIHQSVKDFLLGKSELLEPTSAAASLLIIPSKAHSHLAQVCITYLAFPDFDTSGLSVQVVQKEPFMQYATCWWVTHAPLAEPCEGTVQMAKFGWPKRHNFRMWLKNYMNVKLWGDSDDRVISEMSEWENPLFLASQIGLLADVKYFLLSLELGGSNESIKTVSRALIVAALGGHETTVQLLLEKGADTNAQGGRYGNALQAAAYWGHEKIVQLLLEKGADTNAQGGYYGNALQAAAEGGHEKIVQLLLEKGADTNAQGGHYGNALQAAAEGGHEKTVQLFLRSGADADPLGERLGNAMAEGDPSKVIHAAS